MCVESKNKQKIDAMTQLTSVSSSSSQVKLFMLWIINIIFSWSIHGFIMRLAAINMSDITEPEDVDEDPPLGFHLW